MYFYVTGFPPVDHFSSTQLVSRASLGVIMVPSSASLWALSSQHLQADNLFKTVTSTLFSPHPLLLH